MILALVPFPLHDLKCDLYTTLHNKPFLLQNWEVIDNNLDASVCVLQYCTQGIVQRRGSKTIPEAGLLCAAVRIARAIRVAALGFGEPALVAALREGEDRWDAFALLSLKVSDV